ncbi:hypothetical protein GCM10011482_07520 [Enterococcus alcedinis]|uniref:Uncharacterized protein n=1 Tax=Enterococcus alcedinis TaxID=1274384 RepID=A0A917JDY9_9ENTE|nr:hypothetical protein GCM10011482_07520 [Enterococcus alcedinis]
MFTWGLERSNFSFAILNVPPKNMNFDFFMLIGKQSNKRLLAHIIANIVHEIQQKT